AATEKIPGVGRVKGFSDAAFALGLTQPSDLIEADDAVYLLEPIERIDPQVPALADLGTRPADDAKQGRGDVLAKEQAEKLLARAKDVGLEKAAAEQGLKVQGTGAVEHGAGVVPKLGAAADLRNDAFSLSQDHPLGTKVYSAGNDAVVMALKERIPADPAGLAEAKDGLKTTLLQQKQQDALQAFMNHL